MHYYTFKPKDYMSKTAFLEPMEDLAYRRMLDHCYLTESPLPESIDEIAMLIRMRTHCESIATVLRYFFELTPSGYVNDRVERELLAYHSKSNKAKASAEARWSKDRNKIKVLDVDANAMRTHCEDNANGMLTNNHKPITINDKPLVNNTEVLDKPTRFMFNKELVNLGCDKELVIAYMAHRKIKKASNSKIAFDGLIREQQKSGMDLNSVMRLCIERGWRGFEAEWVNKQISQNNFQQQNRPPDIGQFMRNNAEQFFDVSEDQFYLENKQ